MKRSITLFAIVLTSITALAFGGVASAVNTGGIGARPASPDPNNERTKSIFVYEIEPGNSIEDAVLVSNNTNEDKTIEVYAVDGQTTNSGSFACKQKAEARTGAGGWITLSESEVFLESGSQQEVPLEVSLPEQADVGEHNACIVVAEVDNRQETSDGGVALRFRSALRVAINVPGDIEKSLTLDDISLEQTTAGDYVLSAQIRNDGNVSVDADVQVRLNGFIVPTLENQGVFPVLPRDTAVIRLQVDRPYWGGFYRAEANVTYDSNPDNRIGQTENAEFVTVDATSDWTYIRPTDQALIIIAGVVATIGVIVVYVLFRKGILRNPRHRELVKYRVKPDDNIQAIADRCNTNWKSLARMNRIKPPYHLKAGSIIKVPKPKQKPRK